jgi:hypothetical protein
MLMDRRSWEDYIKTDLKAMGVRVRKGFVWISDYCNELSGVNRSLLIS